MVANYALNFLVIGIPVLKVHSVPVRSVATDLIVLTVLGQLADRLGAILALIVLLPYTASISFFWPLLALNFLFSGIAVGALALYFLLGEWHVRSRAAWAIAVAAAIFTNPAWVLWLLAIG
jgi:hypothetical protein